MNLNLTKPIAFFDLESTGLDVSKDSIIEICILKVNPDQTEETLTSRIKPIDPLTKQVRPMSKEASEITGITDADLANCPTFKEIAEKLIKFLDNCDLGGFNSNKFDIPLLVEEFLRAGINFDMASRKCIDVQVIYHKMEQRNLTAAYKFYCNKDLKDAHSALGDTAATYEVLKSQLDMYAGTIENNVEFLSNYSAHNKIVDYAGRMIYNEKGEAIFNFGKHKGKTVIDVLTKLDRGYYDWIMKNDFTLDTKQKLTEIKLKFERPRPVVSEAEQLKMLQQKFNGK